MMPQDRPASAVIALGASAGGVEALSTVVAGLPAGLPAAIVVVLHLPTSSYSALPDILSRSGPLSARHPEDGQTLNAGTIYVAPPGHHLCVGGGRARLTRGPRENGHRPSVDVLFRSVAETYGPAGAGVVLSGYLDDGAAGLAAIKHAGGFSVVQEPSDAAFPDMPRAAIGLAEPDALCPAAQVYSCLSAWLEGAKQRPVPRVTEVPVPQRAYSPDPEAVELTEFTCPECGGTLWLEKDHGATRFRCRVGHGFSTTGLMVGKQEALEAALWSAIVALDERRDLNRRIRDRLAGGQESRRLAYYEREMAESERRAQVLRDLFDELVESVGDMNGKEKDLSGA
jgi:two-component system chemotaxis response regulator CheB